MESRQIQIALSVLLLWSTTFTIKAQTPPPDNTFKQAQGRMYCEALHRGYTIDRSFHQSAIPCCGGEEHHDAASPRYLRASTGGHLVWPLFWMPFKVGCAENQTRADAGDEDD